MTAVAKHANVVEALSAVMNEITSVGKDGLYQDKRGTRYNFRGVDGVVNAVGPALRAHGVVPMPLAQKVTYRDVTSSGGSAMRESTVEVTYRFYGPGGVEDFIDATVPGEALDVSDKGTAKAMSVAYRIALLQALCIPTNDADPDAERPERGSHPAQASRPTQPYKPAQDGATPNLAGLLRSVGAAESDKDLDAVRDTVEGSNLSDQEKAMLFARVDGARSRFVGESS